MADQSAACVHDWRLHKSRVEEHYQPAPDPWTTTVVLRSTVATFTYDTWYCTRCRAVEERVRV